MKGKQLKLLRIRHDIKAKDIASAIGVSRCYISILEGGRQSIPVHIYDKWVAYIESVSGDVTVI